jgi:hypothetical protein
VVYLAKTTRGGGLLESALFGLLLLYLHLLFGIFEKLIFVHTNDSTSPEQEIHHFGMAFKCRNVERCSVAVRQRVVYVGTIGYQ